MDFTTFILEKNHFNEKNRRIPFVYGLVRCL